MRRALVRRLDRRLDRAGLLRFDGASQQYPSNGAEFTALTGLTASSLYLFDEASGTLDDKIGSADLTAVGTPTYGVTREGRRGVHYDDVLDANRADVNAVGTSSFVAFGVFGIQPSPPPQDYAGLMGRTNITGAEEWAVWRRTNNDVTARIRDSGTNERTLTVAGTTFADNLHFVALQVDRAAATARLRVVRSGGTALTASGSVAGFATLDGASQAYGFGPGVGSTPFRGAFVGWGGIAMGVQCEGASILQNLSRALGWE